LSTRCDARLTIDRRRRAPISGGQRRASLVNLDIAVIAGTGTVAAPGVDGTDPDSREKDEW